MKKFAVAAFVALLAFALPILSAPEPPQKPQTEAELRGEIAFLRGEKRALEAILALGADPPVKPKPEKYGRGFKLPPKEIRDAWHRVSEVKHGAIRKSIPVANQATYDARALKIIPPVGNQGSCGNCYWWSCMKVCSSAQMAAKVVAQDGKFMLSVQWGLDVHPEQGGCNGGDEYSCAQLIQGGGAPSLAQYPGAGQSPGTPQSTTGMTLYTVSSLVMVGSSSGVAATQDIKNYCAAYGYVSVAADASTEDWSNYTTGTLTGTGTSIDHAIGIVGWDDGHDNGDGSKGAWIMQNNWDTSWGNNCANSANPTPTEPGGYAWVKYGADSLGTEAFVAVAGSGPVPPTPPGPPVPPVPPGPGPTPGAVTVAPGTYTISVDASGNVTFSPVTAATTLGQLLTPTTPTPGPSPSDRQLLDAIRKILAEQQKGGK